MMRIDICYKIWWNSKCSNLLISKNDTFQVNISEVVNEQVEETEIGENQKQETEIQKVDDKPEPENPPKSATAETNGLSPVDASS